VKPVNLNQLILTPHERSLSLFVGASAKSHQPLYDDICIQLKNSSDLELLSIFENAWPEIVKKIAGNPSQAFGFFLSQKNFFYITLAVNREDFFILGNSFYLKTVIEDTYSHPEFILINVSLYDVKVYKGDFQHLEILQHFEFEEWPKNNGDYQKARFYTPQYLGLLPFKTLFALKSIAQKIQDFLMYYSLPIVVTGLSEIKDIFLRHFKYFSGVISHIHEDFYEKTCAQVLEGCKIFRPVILDFYSLQFKERFKKIVPSHLVVTDSPTMLRALNEGRVQQLILPLNLKIWGQINSDSLSLNLHKERIPLESVDVINELAEIQLRQGGRLQFLTSLFFTQNHFAVAILKGEV
jgi:hypothetical protein